jgi:hypothetical protein
VEPNEEAELLAFFYVVIINGEAYFGKLIRIPRISQYISICIDIMPAGLAG